MMENCRRSRPSLGCASFEYRAPGQANAVRTSLRRAMYSRCTTVVSVATEPGTRFPASGEASLLAGRDVLVEPEEVCRIVFPLQRDKPIVLGPTVRGPHALVTFIAAYVVQVHAFRYERPHRLEGFARPAKMST